MRINHNIQALNAYRNLSRNSTDMSKHLERLSSGLRINRAADDAAGLAISEKMRSQIRGLDMAERNTMDGISLIQTAEGALGTTHEILQRMRELAVQASNGTLEEADREAVQSEIDQLTQEIDRIARTTQFNSKSLLRGTADSKAFVSSGSTPLTYAGNGSWEGVVSADPSAAGTADLTLATAFGSGTGDAETFTVNGKTYEIQTDATPVSPGNIAVPVAWTGSDEDKINNTMTALKNAIQANDPDLVASIKTSAVAAGSSGVLTIQTAQLATPATASAIDVATTAGGASFSGTSLSAPATSSLSNTINLAFNSVPKEGDELVIDNYSFIFTSGSVTPPAIAINPSGKSVSDILTEIAGNLSPTTDLNSVSVVGNSLLLTTTSTDDGTAGSGLEIRITDKDFTTNSGKDLKVNMQIGANSGENMEVLIGVMDAARLGLARQADHKGIIKDAGVDAVAGLDLSSSQDAAAAALGVIDNSIKLVSEERSKLGAYQNRMEHTVDNLGIASENLTSAESRIRDADMAMEMSTFTKTNIINQAATAMLAQANQLPQGILQLLK
ncbi:flagellin N-terminal helical domain-containing protein [Gorillibacterium timonense]|uniref:flagellin N-terminal helical domain-containing protein n=1 Tax=Gorillibacterium timonense TaxID=1689269 RepID=UPI00071C9CBB|nr:flagellin [Gorillibacterium timonense]